MLRTYFAPDTGDHMNWGCRVMGAWYGPALAAAGAPVSSRTGSAWFAQNNPAVPMPKTLAELQAIAAQVRAGTALADAARILADCDLVYLNAENYLRPRTIKGRRLLLIAHLAKKVFGKRCILSNATLDMTEPALAEMAAAVLPALDEVHVRDEASLAQARALGVPSPRLIPDVAWTVPAAPREQWQELARRPGHFDAWPDSAGGFDPGADYVTLCASSLYAQPEHAGLDWVPAFVRLARALQAEVGQVLLAAPCEVDVRILRAVHRETGLPLLGNGVPVRQAIDVLGNARVHVGGRWHLGIFASTGGTPLVALSANSHKMTALCQQLPDTPEPFDALTVDREVDAIVAAAKAQMHTPPARRAAILQRSRELAAQVTGNLDGVRRWADQASP